MDNLPDIDKYFTPEIVATFASVQQPRSEFQIEKFVIGQHPTPEMQYYQTILEIQNLYYTIKQVALEMKKTEIEIERLRATGDEIDEVNAQIKELGLEQTRVVGIGAFRELDIFLRIKENYPAYTREQIEQAQPDYWNNRLTNQATMEAIANGNPNAASNLLALDQIGQLEPLLNKKEIA